MQQSNARNIEFEYALMFYQDCNATHNRLWDHYDDINVNHHDQCADNFDETAHRKMNRLVKMIKRLQALLLPISRTEYGFETIPTLQQYYSYMNSINDE